jgi:hypothetical protein
MKYKLIASILLMMTLLIGCNLKEPNASPEAAASPPVSNPQADKATITGRVLTKEGNEPVSDEIIRLAEVTRQGDQGAYVLNLAFSPGARSDAQGYFIFDNIPPVEYVMIVGDIYAAHEVLSDVAGKPLTWSTEAGKVLDTGVHYVDLTP